METNGSWRCCHPCSRSHSVCQPLTCVGGKLIDSFILSFTQAPIKGWNSAIFIAPFVVSLVLFVVFFVYEAYLPRGYALLPQDIWSYPNLFPLMLQASSIFMWMACAQLRIATYFQVALGNSPILAAVKLLPMGITALIVGVGSQAAPWLITRPRYVQPVSSVLCFAGSMLFAYSGGGHGSDYWKFMFTGQVIGTAGKIASPSNSMSTDSRWNVGLYRHEHKHHPVFPPRIRRGGRCIFSSPFPR